MIRSSVLAEKLYSLALEAKQYAMLNLRFKRHREELLCRLLALQYGVACLGVKEISDAQAGAILDVLEQCLCTRFFEFSSLFLAADSKCDRSESYDELLFFMQTMLADCISTLRNRETGYVEKVRMYLHAFHNLPRPFLSVTDSRFMSVAEAKSCAMFDIGHYDGVANILKGL